MAVQAAAAEHPPRNTVIVRLIVVDLTYMSSRSLFLMTLDAQKRLPACEGPAIDRAVGVVTKRAVLGDGKMFEEEWTAFLRMTGVAVVVDGEGVE